VHLTIDWTSEGDQHLLVVGRRALPIYWRAYEQSTLKGHMKRYERAVIKRAFKLIFNQSSPTAFGSQPIAGSLTPIAVRCLMS
jgi:hypothetical protein